MPSARLMFDLGRPREVLLLMPMDGIKATVGAEDRLPRLMPSIGI